LGTRERVRSESAFAKRPLRKMDEPLDGESAENVTLATANASLKRISLSGSAELAVNDQERARKSDQTAETPVGSPGRNGRRRSPETSKPKGTGTTTASRPSP
jgi:hypothetical protein